MSQLLSDIRYIRKSVLEHSCAKKCLANGLDERLTEIIPKIAQTDMDHGTISSIYGELQFIFIEAQGDGDARVPYARMRNSAYAAIIALFKREEFLCIEDILRKNIFPLFAATVNAGRGARMQATIDAVTGLRELGLMPKNAECRWLLIKLADMQYPRFGTSGWRARMGIDFTWKRAEYVAKGIVQYIIESGLSARPLSIGYDSRINADKIADLVADIASANGIDVHLASRETPSPALIDYITDTIGITKNSGLINCTPSHNPVKDPDTKLYMGTEYHGIRYNMPYGGVAPADVTDAIGFKAMEFMLEDNPYPTSAKMRGKITYFDPRKDYIEKTVNGLENKEIIKEHWKDGIAIIDEMHSSSRGYIRYACDLLEIPHIVLHDTKDPLLGELTYANPEPPHINMLAKKVKELSAQYKGKIIGLGFDTDSDRFGVVDENGEYFMMNNLLPVLAEYMLNENYNGSPGFIIRNMATTRMLDRIAYANRDKVIPPKNNDEVVLHAKEGGYEVFIGDKKKMSGFLTHVVPVGFKYIASIMMEDLISALKDGESDDILEQKFKESLAKLLIAGEESNGMTSRNHTPDKDGLWGAVLTLQMCAVKGMGVKRAWSELTDKYGTLVSKRRDVSAPNIAKTALVNTFLDRYLDEKTNNNPYFIEPDTDLCSLRPIYVGGVRNELAEIVALDEEERENYITIRASGTEAINRIYVETPNPDKLESIVDAVGIELEKQIIHAINESNFEEIVDILQNVEIMSYEGESGTFNDRIVDAAVKRITELHKNDTERYLIAADAALREKNALRGGKLVKDKENE